MHGNLAETQKYTLEWKKQFLDYYYIMLSLKSHKEWNIII